MIKFLRSCNGAYALSALSLLLMLATSDAHAFFSRRPFPSFDEDDDEPRLMGVFVNKHGEIVPPPPGTPTMATPPDPRMGPPNWDSQGQDEKQIDVKVVGDKKAEQDKKVSGFARLKGKIPEEMTDLARYLKDPSIRKKLPKYGITIPKGILLHGKPGVGKTRMVEALIQETGCEYIATTATMFAGMLVGQGAANIRKLFKDARDKAKKKGKDAICVIFIDELETLARRDKKDVHEETKNMVRELLAQMDGMEDNSRVVVIGATNFPETIDKALLRPGRFDKKIEIPLPDEPTRLEILKHYADGVVFAEDVPWELVAEYTSNFSPADLQELIRRSGLKAFREDRPTISQQDVIDALKKCWHERRVQGEKDIPHMIDMIDKAFKNPGTTVKGFAAIAGDVEEEVRDLVKYLDGTIDYKKMNIDFPHGILLVGPPGTGKTMLVRALAQEAGCEFINAKGSEFIEKYVGIGAKRVRELFDEARKKAEANKNKRTILFIDEIDAIGSRRSLDNAEAQRTIGQLLTEMDGFYKDDSVLIVAATNFPEVLDKALLRRFDTTIKVPIPSRKKRLEVVKMYAKDKPIDKEISLEEIAGEMTYRWTPAELKNLINDATKLAAGEGSKTVKRVHFEEAWDRHVLGKKIKDIVQTPIEQRMTAYHEAGHAMIPLLLQESSDPLYKITIIPRSQALGVTYTLRDREKHSQNREELRSFLIHAMAGCAAEELVFGKLTTGASNDFEKASQIARDMICKYGMSDKVGKINYTNYNEYNHSQEKAAQIDAEVKVLIDECYAEAKRLLQEHRDQLNLLAEELYKKKTMFAKDVYPLLGIQKLERVN